MKLLALGWMLFILLCIVSCFRESSEQVTVARQDAWQDKNDPNDPDYLNNQEPFSVDDGEGGTVFFKEGKEDE